MQRTIAISAMAFSFLLALTGLARPAAAQCNEDPVALDDRAEFSGSLAFVDVLANDFEADGEALRVVISTGECGSSGVFSETGGVVTYTADGATPRTCRFSYQLIDEAGSFDQAEVIITGPAFFSDDFENGDLGRWSSVCLGCPPSD